MTAAAATPDRLIRTLFGSLTDADWTSAFLHELCRATRTQSAALVAANLRAHKDTLATYVGAEAAAAAAYEQRFGAVNPWRAANDPYRQHPGDVVVSDEVLSLPALKRTSFWTDFLRPMDVGHGVGLIGLKSPQEVASLTLLRGERAGVYRGRELALLRAITPHWVNACSIRSRLGALTESVRVYDGTVDRLELGVFFIGADGTMLRANPSAESLLQAGVLGLRAGRLVARHGAARVNLQQALDDALADPAAGAPATSSAVVLHDASGKNIAHATPHRLTGSSATPAHGVRAVVFVQLVGPRDTSEQLRQALRTVYGLTGREAELVTRLDVGEKLEDAAVAMGLTEGACRTRLKTVFGKTATRSQNELSALARSLRGSLGV